MECRTADRGTQILKCEYCGQEVKVPRHKYNKIISGEQKHFYCSTECRYSNERPTMDELFELFQKKGYTLISKEYVTAKTPLKYICNQHKEYGVQEINYSNFKSGYGCKYCGYEKIAENKRTNWNDVKEAFSNKGLFLLEQEYKNATIPLKYICSKHPEHGIQYMTYNNVLYNIGCPHCSSSRGEYCVSQYLMKNNIEFVQWKKFDDLIGIKGKSLSYDFYVPSKNLLIEYQGQFHDGTANIQTHAGFLKQQEHDKRKRQYAKDNGYELLEIWYYENTEEKLDFFFNNN